MLDIFKPEQLVERRNKAGALSASEAERRPAFQRGLAVLNIRLHPRKRARAAVAAPKIYTLRNDAGDPAAFWPSLRASRARVRPSHSLRREGELWEDHRRRFACQYGLVCAREYSL